MSTADLVGLLGILLAIGLIVFIAMVGMHAGPHAVQAYQTSGGAYFASIFAACMIVTIVPLAAGTIAAHYFLRMSPLMTSSTSRSPTPT